MFVFLVPPRDLFLIALCSLLDVSESLLRCSQVFIRPQPEFQLIRSCAVPSSSFVASDRISTFDECQSFASEHWGLALSFVRLKELQDEDEDNCIVFDCPMIDSSLLDEGIYDYYSIYSDIDPDGNATCIPSLGLYQLNREPANYSEAVTACSWAGGQLARVTTADHTSQLSTIVAALGNSKRIHLAYIGLNDIEQEGSFVTVTDEPLNCFAYRGWAPGQPRSRRNSEDCVVLDSRQGWRVVDCERKLPYLCELLSSEQNTCGHVTNKRWKQKCLAEAVFEKDMKRKRINQRCLQYNSNSE